MPSLDSNLIRSTRDERFALHSIITLCKRIRLYCAFIDFKKALSKVGIKGKLLNVIKVLFNDVKSCIVVNGR